MKSHIVNIITKPWFTWTLGILVIIALGALFRLWWSLGNNIGYAPEQPIPFSHKLHAGQYQIPCQYCHVGVETSASATVPPLNVCMNCHAVVATDKPAIQALTTLYKEGKPVEWVKVHDLPDHARFNHAAHIRAGVPCATCHGDVTKMNRIAQVKTLQMGFCMDCHLDNPQWHNEALNAPKDCQSCHY